GKLIIRTGDKTNAGKVDVSLVSRYLNFRFRIRHSFDANRNLQRNYSLHVKFLDLIVLMNPRWNPVFTRFLNYRRTARLKTPAVAPSTALSQKPSENDENLLQPQRRIYSYPS